MKILAGGKFLVRNPPTAPMNATVTSAPARSPSQTKKSSRNAAVTMAIVLDSPSMLSRRLNALVMPTTQNNVSSTSASGNPVSRRENPRKSRTLPSRS